MSKTWRVNGGVKDSGFGAKRAASQKVRRTADVGNGGSYKKIYEQWYICDWSFITNPREESYRYHNPHLGFYCICDFNPYSRHNSYVVDAPEPVYLDRNWVLPDGYGFRLLWRSPRQRVNPETGAYEKLVRVVENEFVGSRQTDADYRFNGIGFWRSNCRIQWREKVVDKWVPNEDPQVYKYVERPYFTEDDVRKHVESREEETRNYRKKARFPRYWRRDRKRARNMKRG